MTPDALDQEHLDLLAAIGRALGQDTAYEESGPSLKVLGGAVSPEPERVAWIEEQSDARTEGYVPVSIELHVARGGHRISRKPVPTYNPYFGCRVQHMRWYGDTLILIYREKHQMLLARMDPPYSGLELVQLHDHCIVDGDTVYFASERSGLLEGRLLPSLTPALPVPLPGSDRAKVEAARAAAPSFALPPLEARALVEAPERLRARLQELLAATKPPRFGVDVLVGSVATPFWRPDQPRGTRYESLSQRGNSPEYLAVYWHRHLVAKGFWAGTRKARAWLHWLEQVAALDVEPAPWTLRFRGEELVARTALTYLRARAAVLAEVCRTGELPEGEWCYFFAAHNDIGSLEGDEAYPPGFREVLRQVASSRPKSLSAG